MRPTNQDIRRVTCPQVGQRGAQVPRPDGVITRQILNEIALDSKRRYTFHQHPLPRALQGIFRTPDILGSKTLLPRRVVLGVKLH